MGARQDDDAQQIIERVHSSLGTRNNNEARSEDTLQIKRKSQFKYRPFEIDILKKSILQIAKFLSNF